MFLFNLEYCKPIPEVERVLPEHIRFLDQYYEAGKFLCSGRKIPRTGGVILSLCSSREEAEEIVRQDPFFQAGIARYELTEFLPSKSSEAFARVIAE